MHALVNAVRKKCCDNSVVKHFIIADNDVLSHLGRGILSYLRPLAGGILSEGDLSRGILSG